MNPLDEKNIQCPHCGEAFDILVDCTTLHQMYIEDCMVCCCPIEITIELMETGSAQEIVVHTAPAQ